MKISAIEQQLRNMTQKISLDKDLIGAIVYGSYLIDRVHRDVDVALICKENLNEKGMFDKRLEYSRIFSEIFDIQIFQQLPTSVQKNVLKGRVLYETAELYDVAYKTIREYSFLKKYIDEYIEETILEN